MLQMTLHNGAVAYVHEGDVCAVLNNDDMDAGTVVLECGYAIEVDAARTERWPEKLSIMLETIARRDPVTAEPTG